MVRPAVDLPQPLSPTRATPSTALTSPTFLRSTPAVIGKYFCRSVTDRIGSLMRGPRGVVSGARDVVGSSCEVLGGGGEPSGSQLGLLGRREMAPGEVPGGVLVQLGADGVAEVARHVLVVLAARPEHAPLRQVDQRRRLPGDGLQSL